MKRNKYIIYNFFVIITLIILITIIIFVRNSKEYNKTLISMEKVTDECISESQESQEVVTSSAEQKLLPSAQLIIRKHYSGCGHTINENVEILPEMVNKNQEEIEKEYSNLTVAVFAPSQLVMKKEEKGFCGEHYILRDVNGKVVINSIDENDNENFLRNTAIPTQYLTQTDLISLKDGVRVYGKENLNKILEDYE